MPSRSAAVNPASPTRPPMASTCPESRKAANACWSSRNAGMPLRSVHDLLCVRGFLDQHRECGQVRVPFDERRHLSKQGYGLGVEGPDCLADARAVIVDPDRAAVVELTKRVPRQMDFPDPIAGQRAKVTPGIEAMIAGAHEDVVHVAEDVAAGEIG